MDSSSDPSLGASGSQVRSPPVPTAEVVMFGLTYPVLIAPLGTGEFRGEFASTSAVASKPELDICATTG